ncbi:MerR family transcriptional regulator [Pseudomonas sp. PDM16]|uniref:MerR family transcriptional regulator n=1 Tax=Pseudomonas sp. PDM16 TaxID=2769292 RepID=UPI001783D633|nr:MerR family transcriptional regulator [Pseudomonas sp. PDM16]MBD9413535.1 MerR family transcriptional regulator [Pseudomonas sp. PDM16]
MYIGELARLTGASPKAIRLYESQGLLGAVPRAGSYRHYGDDQLQQVQLIRQAQRLGFSLSELRQALGEDPAQPDWQALQIRIEDKRRDVQAEIVRLRRLDRALAEVAEEIASCTIGTEDCAFDTP